LISELQNQLQEILGPSYRIDRELGGAGMSRVFVATELELDRQIVVKVLPPDLSAGINTDRFRREIQLAARLQHPHIVPLLATGARGSLLYYTMPFISGENLRARLNRSGDLPVQEATKILREVADALGYAHAQGVVHRDIKPENILISGNHVLVTDFGVSKALSSATSETPTEAPTLTSLGIALGTPAYMAPEQAAADPSVDGRADIYALGIVGYELLTGHTPFAGLNQQQTLAAHITTAVPPITHQRPQLPPALAAVIMRCIEKRPSDRFQSAEDLHTALEPYAMTSGATAPSAAMSRKAFQWTPQRVAVAAGVIGLVAAGVIASTVAFRHAGQALAIGNTKQVTNAAGMEIIPRISPDGKLIAYSVADGRSYKTYVKQIAGGRAILVADSGAFATWQPDASALLYSSPQGRNYTVPALGGVPTLVPLLDSLGGCTYSNAGDRIACRDLKNGSIVVSTATGESRKVVRGTGGEDAMMPAWSADDKLLAFSLGNSSFFVGDVVGNIAPSSIWVVRADGGSPVRVSDNTHLNVSPVWTPDGALLFVSSMGGNRDIYMVGLNGDLSPRGEPARLTTGLNAHTISLDRAGTTLAYSVFTTAANIWATPIATTDPEHPLLHQVTTGNQTVESAAVSPDHKWIAYDSNINGNQDIFKMPLAGGEPEQLTHNGVDNFYPQWSPDGKQIAFHALFKGNRDIYVMDPLGGNVSSVAATPKEELQPIWRGDGKGLDYRIFPDSDREVMRDPSRPGGWGAPTSRGQVLSLAFSPDGKQLLAVNRDSTSICGNCPTSIFLLASDWTNPRPVLVPAIQKVFAVEGTIGWGTIVWAKDSRHAFVSMIERDGSSSIWQLPINGDAEKRIVHLDSGHGFYRTTLDVDANNFYFSIGDRQSDIWTMELKKR
jgi:eukaryotic-like serine/threonine-protein kinase